MSKHTPGPWTIEPRYNNMIDVIHHNNQPGAITMSLCRVQARQSWIAEAEANARLIAAAPDLLEALQMVRDADDDCRRDGLQTIPSMARNRIDAAIAKAEGAA